MRSHVVGAAACIALLVVALVPNVDAANRMVVVTTTIQAAVDAAAPGDTVSVPPGIYHETVTITKSGITIKGTRGAVLDSTGFAVGIRASSGPTVIGPDGFPVCPTFALHDLAVEGLTFRGASFTGVLFRGVDGFSIRDGNYDLDGAYALFPICSRDGVIERNRVEGTRDGAIYVGDSWDILVADNDASASTVGIEIENSIGVTVSGNRATGNTAGIAVFSLPGLPVPMTSDVQIAGNTVTANNMPNPLTVGGDVLSLLPTGSGIVAVAVADSLIAGNRVNANATGGIAVLAFPLPFNDPRFIPLPQGVAVRDNTVNGNGSAPDALRWPLPGADLIHDGSGSAICFQGNRFTTSVPTAIESVFADCAGQ